MSYDIDTLLGSTLQNLLYSYLDTFIEANTKLGYDAGLKETVVRTCVGVNNCNWCLSLQGTYKYPDEVPKDVWRRHVDCDCVITHISDRGVQNVHSKKMLSNNDIEELRQQKINELILNKHNKQTRINIDKLKLTPGEGKIISEDKKFKPGKHKDECETAKYLIKKYGGDVKLKKELNTKKMYDFDWQNISWELKNCSSKNSLDQNVREATKKFDNKSIKNKGIMINNNTKLNDEEVIKVIENRLNRQFKNHKGNDNFHIFIINKNNNSTDLFYTWGK